MFERNVKLSQHSNYKIGGHAAYFYEAKKAADIAPALEHWRKHRPNSMRRTPVWKDTFVLAGGTNLLINDEGYKGLILKPALTNLSLDGELVRVGAGVLMRDLLEFAAEKGLAGLEWAGGLPGTLGGAVRGNAGAFGGEIKDSVFEVVSLDISKKVPKVTRRMGNECGFGYRNSIFKEKNGKEIILEAVLTLKRGDPRFIRESIREKINFRNSRHPMDYPNIGSIFKNVDLKTVPKKRHAEFSHIVKSDPFPVVPTAYLISQTGLKGVSYGGAMISPKHPNFIVNVLSASSEDVKKLIKLVKFEVKNKFDIQLEEEIIYV